MKVAELITILQTMPQDVEILLETGDPDMACDIASVMYTDDKDDGRLMIDDNDNRLPFVIIQFGMEPREVVTAEEAGDDEDGE